MKYIFIILVFSISMTSSYCQLPKCSKIDSIEIKQVDFDLIFAVALSRNQFDSFYEIESDKALTILEDSISIKKICMLLYNLIEETDSVYLKNLPEEITFKQIKTNKGKIAYIYTDPLDIRAKITIYTDQYKTTLWADRFHIDIGNKRYKMTQTLYEKLNCFYIEDN